MWSSTPCGAYYSTFIEKGSHMQIAAFKRLTAPFRFRNFTLLWIGQTISAFGSPFQVVALAWLILLFCLLQLLEAPLLAGFAFTPLPLAMACLASVGALNGLLSVMLLSLIQTNVAKELLGRMMSFFMLASMSFVPLSLLLSGLVANAWGIQTLFVAAGLLTAVSAACGALVPSLRRLN